MVPRGRIRTPLDDNRWRDFPAPVEHENPDAGQLFQDGRSVSSSHRGIHRMWTHSEGKRTAIIEVYSREGYRDSVEAENLRY